MSIDYNPAGNSHQMYQHKSNIAGCAPYAVTNKIAKVTMLIKLTFNFFNDINIRLGNSCSNLFVFCRIYGRCDCKMWASSEATRVGLG